MKHFYNILIIIGLFFGSSCQKENTANEIKEFNENNSVQRIILSQGIPYDKIFVAQSSSINIKGIKNMLSFPDMQTFENVIYELRRQMEEHSAIIADLPENVNTPLSDENKPINDFLSHFGYDAMFVKKHMEEDFYDANMDILHLEDPDDTYLLCDEVMALFNENGEVKIGNDIYRQTDSGYAVYKPIAFGSNRLSGPSFTQYAYSFIAVSAVDDCCKGSRSSKKIVTSGDEQYRIKCRVTTNTIVGKLNWSTAKIKNYKKKSGRWVKIKTDCFAQVYGNMLTLKSSCENAVPADINPGRFAGKSETAKTLAHTIFHNGTRRLTKTKWIKGAFSGAGALSCDVELEFSCFNNQ